MSALTGKRILITRAHAQSSSLQQLLEAQGAEVVAIPAIEIVPPESYAALDAALREIVSFDWLVLTSANAVHAIVGRLETMAIPLETLCAVYIAAIGVATADAITALGLPVETIPRRPVAESLAEALAPRVSGERVLLARAKVARDLLPEALRQAGAFVTIADAYQTIIPSQSVDALRSVFLKSNRPIDAITFTSASAVWNFIALLEASGATIPSDVKKISIGPITTQAIEEKGWRADAEAANASIHELVEAVVKSFAG
jgi:uroporphyrinogen-III synthase